MLFVIPALATNVVVCEVLRVSTILAPVLVQEIHDFLRKRTSAHVLQTRDDKAHIKGFRKLRKKSLPGISVDVTHADLRVRAPPPPHPTREASSIISATGGLIYVKDSSWIYRSQGHVARRSNVRLICTCPRRPAILTLPLVRIRAWRATSTAPHLFMLLSHPKSSLRFLRDARRQSRPRSAAR